MKDEILKIQQKIKMKEAAKNLVKHYRLEESQELMNVPLGKLKFDSKMTKENYEKELLDFYYTFNDEPPTPKIFGEIGKIAERLFTNVSKHEGLDHELRVIPQGELLPCPFCGGKVNGFKRRKDREDVYMVSCLNCGIDTPKLKTQELVKELWNKRVKL